MARQLKLTGVTLSNPALPNVGAYQPAIGVAGYGTRRRSSTYAALPDGAEITQGWLNEVDGTRLTVAGAPLRHAASGGINCISRATAGFTGTGPAYGTFLFVFNGYHGAGGGNAAFLIGAGAGRQLVKTSDRWRLQTDTGGTDSARLDVLFSAVPFVVDRKMIAALTLSADGSADSLRIVGGGADSATSGACSKANSSTRRLGKPTSGTAGLGTMYFEEVVFPQRLLTTAELNTAIGALKAIHSVA